MTRTFFAAVVGLLGGFLPSRAELPATTSWYRQEEALQGDRLVGRVVPEPILFNAHTARLEPTAEWRALAPLASTARVGPWLASFADAYAARRAGQTVGAAFRFDISSNGLYRIRYQSLLEAGISPALLQGSALRLFCGPSEVALFVSCGNALMGPSDFALFYGWAADSYYTSTNAFWLGLGGSGRRMATASASVRSNAPDVDSYSETLTRAEDRVYLSLDWPMDSSTDHWFDTLLANVLPPFVFPLETSAVVPGTPASCTFQGRGYNANPGAPDHLTEILVNGVSVGTVSFDGRAAVTGSLAFSSSLLFPQTQITLRQATDQPAVDAVYLEAFGLTYRRSCLARADRLLFQGEAGSRNYRVRGLGTGHPYVLDVSVPDAPVLAQPATVQPRNSMDPAWSLRFGWFSDQPPALLVCGPLAIADLPPPRLVPFRNLADPARGADYILICPSTFRDSAYRLLRRRHLEGLRVVVAPVEDVVNEFNYGIHDAVAIRNFLGYAFHHWQLPRPRYVLLAGQGTYDPRNRLGSSPPDLLPVPLGPTLFQWTARDPWLACVNGEDSLSDMAVGRIPAASDADCSAVVDKIEAFEAAPPSAPWRQRALFVADNNDGINFRASAETLRTLWFAGATVTTGYLDDWAAAAVRSLIASQFSQGVGHVLYIGHGSIDSWASENLFTVAQAAALKNTVYPLVSVLTCQNGYFHDPRISSLAAALVLPARRGASACVAPAGLSIQAFADAYGAGLCEALGATRLPRAGDCALLAAQRLWQAHGNVNELLFYHLLGDPGMVVNQNE